MISFEIGLEMLGSDGAVVGAEQPALGEAEDEVDGRQMVGGIGPRAAEIDRRVGVALGGEAAIAGPAVRRDQGRRRDVALQEAVQAPGRSVGHSS